MACACHSCATIDLIPFALNTHTRTLPNAVSCDDAHQFLGAPSAPDLIDIRIDEDVDARPALIPGARRRDFRRFDDWRAELFGRRAVVICHRGEKLSQGVASLLRGGGVDAAALAGGTEAWAAAGRPLIPLSALPDHTATGGARWVARTPTPIDDIACAWLIRRFVDRTARFLFVASPEVAPAAERLGATPFGVDAPARRQGDDRCAFETTLEALNLGGIPPLARLATTVRSATTERFDVAPEAAGLRAAALGLRALVDDDHAGLAASLPLYDALYRRFRDEAAVSVTAG